MEILAKEFYKLLRLHSREKKAQLKTKLRLEAHKARKECAKNFWRFAAKILDDDDTYVHPTFSVEAAQSYFQKIYSCEPQTFSRPDWLPIPPTPTTHFNDDVITPEEVSEVIGHSKPNSSPSPIDRISYQILKHFSFPTESTTGPVQYLLVLRISTHCLEAWSDSPHS